MNILDINWASAGGMLTVFGILFSVVFLVMQARLTRTFVTQGQHDKVVDRVRGIEDSLSSMPRHADMQALERRFGEMAERVSGLSSSIQGIKEDTGAVRYQLNMLIDAQLKAEQKG